MRLPHDIYERLRGKIKKTETCWFWLASTNKNGYGKISIKRKTLLAHRVLASLYLHNFRDDLLVLHACDNPPCVNPAHLFVGTHSDNVRDAVSKGRWTQVSGENNGYAKVNREIVEKIRAEYTLGVRQRAIASKYGVSQAQVSNIITHKHWP